MGDGAELGRGGQIATTPEMTKTPLIRGGAAGCWHGVTTAAKPGLASGGAKYSACFAQAAIQYIHPSIQPLFVASPAQSLLRGG